MKDILLKFGIPILTALLAFIGSVYKSKVDLKKQIELNNMELQKIQQQCSNELEKIKLQMDKQVELYERNSQTDVTKAFLTGEFDINKVVDSLEGLDKLAERAQKMQNKYNFKRK